MAKRQYLVLIATQSFGLMDRLSTTYENYLNDLTANLRSFNKNWLRDFRMCYTTSLSLRDRLVKI